MTHAATPAPIEQASPQPLVIRWTAHPAGANPPTVEVIGLPPATLAKLRRTPPTGTEWARLLAVYAGASSELPPMAGTYSVSGAVVRFTPRFPLQPGITYRAVYFPAGLPGEEPNAAPMAAMFRLPTPAPASATSVRRVYPSPDVLPENLLKFYIHFSAPMSRGRAYEHIRLRDASGKTIELPFLELDEELWDPTMTRLTVFFDPGRIKRGVKPLEEIGAALQAGKRYSLEIRDTWKDARGNPLRETFRKTFRVGPPDRTTPDPARWRILPPPVKTRTPLRVAFPEPMDQALATRLLYVLRENKTVLGEASMGDSERSWTFTPREPWQAGTYTLVIPATIEDLAGNNIGKPFDVDLRGKGPKQAARQPVRLRFTVRSQAARQRR